MENIRASMLTKDMSCSYDWVPLGAARGLAGEAVRRLRGHGGVGMSHAVPVVDYEPAGERRSAVGIANLHPHLDADRCRRDARTRGAGAQTVPRAPR